MEIQRLSWAGIKLTVGQTAIVIDASPEMGWSEGNLGRARTSLLPANAIGAAQVALVTHRHFDHYDPAMLRQCLDEQGAVLCDRGVERLIAEDGLPAVGVDLYTPFETHGVTIVAVPAVDGFGDVQVSWIVEGDGKRIIHCGDTLWHGYWWKLARRYGPFDLAFLPINGVTTHFPNMIQSGLPASLTPEQAVAAAAILQAKAVSPIHYGMFNDPERYEEYPNAEAAFVAAARTRSVPTRIVQPGEQVPWTVGA